MNIFGIILRPGHYVNEDGVLVFTSGIGFEPGKTLEFEVWRVSISKITGDPYLCHTIPNITDDFKDSSVYSVKLGNCIRVFDIEE
jgi:hypothetical protein